MLSILDGMGGTVSLLAAGKRFSAPGIGLSKNARAYTEKFLRESAGGANALFSSTTGAGLTIEDLQTQIKALRSGLSERQLSRSLQPQQQEANPSDGVAPSNNGQQVDTEA